MQTKFKLIAALAACLWAMHCVADTLEPIQITVGEEVLQVEYADSFEERAKGLMMRESLCQQCGMLFNFQQSRQASMWMKDTLIPLDVAFITADGVITDIKSMQPHDLTPVGSSKRVQFALEMNLGWFAERDIKVGDQVIIPH